MNVIEYRERRSDAIIAALGSFVFHLCMIALFILLSVLGVTLVKDKAEGIKEEKTTTLLISPELFEKAPDPVIPEAEPLAKKKKFIPTNPEVAEVEPQNEVEYIGEISTTAASETPLNEGDRHLPTQLTREPEREVPTTFNSDFRDGEIESVSAEAQPSEAEASTIDGQDESEALSAKSDTKEISEETETTTVAVEVDELLETTNNVETPKKEVEEEINKADKEQVATSSPTEGEDTETESTLTAEKPATKPSSDAGFQTEKKKTRIVGSLARDGKSSLDVKSTALGQYYSTISKIIEREWQKNCLQYQEHIQPGIISMQFYIDKDGNITNPKPHDVVSTSPIQVGFTIKSIRKSKLPAMPKAARDELGQEKLELIYNFYF